MHTQVVFLPLRFHRMVTHLSVEIGTGSFVYGTQKQHKNRKPIFTGHKGWIRAAAFLPNGIIFISKGENDTVHLWRTTGETRALLTLQDPFSTAMMFSPDGRTLARTDRNDAILLWDLTTGQHQTTLEGHRHWIFELVFSPDSKTLASGGGDSAVLLWDVDTGQHRATLGKQEVAGGRRDDVFALAFSLQMAKSWQVVVLTDRFSYGRQTQHSGSPPSEGM